MLQQINKELLSVRVVFNKHLLEVAIEEIGNGADIDFLKHHLLLRLDTTFNNILNFPDFGLGWYPNLNEGLSLELVPVAYLQFLLLVEA